MDSLVRPPRHLSNFIDGKHVPPIDGSYIDNINPATNEVICKIPNSNAKDVQKAVEAAKGAFPSWRNTPAQERGQYLLAMAAEIKKLFKEFVVAECRDMGKTHDFATNEDIPGAIGKLEHYVQTYMSETTKYYQMPDAMSVEHRDSVGVVGLITPWNYPILIVCDKIAAAIMCGNTCVLKPTELAPFTTYMLSHIMRNVGLPKGVVNVVHGLGSTAGEALVKHRDVRAISFTGGSATGSHISRVAAPMFKKLQLELGGKNPSIVFEDCYFDETVAGVATAGLINTGQVCTAGSRILVEKSIEKKFVKALVSHIKENFTVGDPKTSVIGPLVSLNHREKVEGYVRLAQEEGGKILIGGKRPTHLKQPFANGAFYSPTVIVGLPYTSRTATEEIFGPVITVHSFESEEEAVRMANVVDYGLAASVWTSDVRKGQRIARQIETGTVWINCWEVFDPRQPFGGVKNSGIGREAGRHSIDFFTEIKPIVSKL